MALSDLIIRQAKATDTLYTLPDGDGLGLAVSPGGGKAWHLRYDLPPVFRLPSVDVYH